MSTYQAMSPEADGIGMLGVGLGANIPIYRKRLEAGVREAEAKTVASAGSTTPCATRPRKK